MRAPHHTRVIFYRATMFYRLTGRNAVAMLRTMIGQRIKLARIERGWTQAELGQKLGVVQSRISDIERNGLVDLRLAQRIASVLDIDVADLVRAA